MKQHWQSLLKYNPIKPLISSGNPSIIFFTGRDLLEQPPGSIQTLWDLPDAQRILRQQQKDGSWKYPGVHANVRSQEDYNQLETYRNLGYLVELYGFNNAVPAIKKAANYLFNFQSKEGDLRGIYGNQYSPNYTAGIIELLIKAGYTDDKRIEKAFEWLIKIRQNDGGWAIPLRTLNKKLDTITMESDALEPDKTRPFSHLVTGVVLRAFAAHKIYRNSRVVKDAAQLLLSHLFKKDSYPDRKTPDYWQRFTFPFWFTDLISAMDSLSLLGISHDEPQIEKALQWFIGHQSKNGLWELKLLKNQKYSPHLWFSLAICRIIRRMH